MTVPRGVLASGSTLIRGRRGLCELDPTFAIFKRNQVVEAIARVLESSSAKPSSELRSRLKRLLDTDRRLGRASRYSHPEEAMFAFYSGEAPGRGVENWFSEYEAFSLLIGLRLMQNGWPQGFAVAVLRRVRGKLEQQHARILKQDPPELFSHEKIVKAARPGALAVNTTDPVFLVISAGHRDHPSASPIACAVCRRQEELMRLMRGPGTAGQSWSVFEVTTSVHALSSELAKTEPRKRGRASE